ncbi:MAG: response regulator transcription factor [Anaerocolumna aminovalerica]|jgi:two-component system response regulator ArlR|uniref:response regulator transcription factor n=1 Tax=Anaerocolumna aminovalerica TaxID=1527 RepID=UPI000BE3BA25|nr:response regulator transcription factor [Anaerocolumna aminovalerica]MBU5333093.1 response regulator transcription factor [Anaerocolumna aminovalerica]MDU6263437.1 response regulator transcription factor [Anaerocolumna aminovalerica]
MKILYVEDEKYMARAVAQVLRKNNYSVDLAYDGENGLDLVSSGLYDIVILDIMLPKLDGIGVLHEMRKRSILTPVILLTAKGETEDKVKGLDSGADDYLAKPFQTEELMARLRALGRRRGQFTADNILCYGDIELNYNTLDLLGNGQTFHLTLKESQLLELLITNKGQAITTEIIIEKLWGWNSDTEDSHVQVQVAFLRKKLSLITKRVKIKTVRGIGYMLILDEEVTTDV